MAEVINLIRQFFDAVLNDSVWVHVGSDVIISLLYCSIPAFLWYYTKKHGKLPLRWFFYGLSCFLIVMGVVNVVQSVSLQLPICRLTGVWKSFFGILSGLACFLWVKTRPARVLPPIAVLDAQHAQMVFLSRAIEEERESYPHHLEEAGDI